MRSRQPSAVSHQPSATGNHGMGRGLDTIFPRASAACAGAVLPGLPAAGSSTSKRTTFAVWSAAGTWEQYSPPPESGRAPHHSDQAARRRRRYFDHTGSRKDTAARRRVTGALQKRPREAACWVRDGGAARGRRDIAVRLPTPAIFGLQDRGLWSAATPPTRAPSSRLRRAGDIFNRSGFHGGILCSCCNAM